MGLFNPHQGSWGLPDFGITELFSGNNRTAQGGSNVFQPQRQAMTSPAPSGQVQGASTTGAPANGGIFAGYGGDPRRGGGGQGVQTPGVQGAPQQVPLEQNPQAPQDNFDSIINPALDALGSYEQAVQGNFQSQLSQADQQGAAQKGEAEAQQAAGLSSLQGQRGEATTSAENAISEARRQAAEIMKGIQARFGGSTGTGAFVSEITGSQATKNIAGHRQALQDVVGKITTAETNIRTETARILDGINQQVQMAKENAKNALQQSLAEIAGKKGELQSRKAELRMAALQNYQQLLGEVEARNTQFKQQLYTRYQDAQQKIGNLKKTAEQKWQITLNPNEQTQIDFTTEGSPQDIQSLIGQFNLPDNDEEGLPNIPTAGGLGL